MTIGIELFIERILENELHQQEAWYKSGLFIFSAFLNGGVFAGQ